MAEPHPRRRRTAWLAALPALLLGSGLPGGPAQANLLQLVTTTFVPGASGSPASDSDEVFVPTSADVTSNILAAIGGFGPGYVATSSAGVFGQVGLSLRNTSAGLGSELRAEVLIGSDEFVNVLGVPVNVKSNFVVDGGAIADFFSTNATVTFTLEVGAENRGAAGPETGRIPMEVAAAGAAAFGGAGGFFPGFEGGRYIATYTTDAGGTPSFSDTVEGGLDLGATVSIRGMQVDIPFSLQSLDLGILQPGDRLLLGYRAEFVIGLDGVAEGIFASFSDPFNLSANSILTSLTFTPLADGPSEIPAPATLPVLATGLLSLLAARRERRSRTQPTATRSGT